MDSNERGERERKHCATRQNVQDLLFREDADRLEDLVFRGNAEVVRQDEKVVKLKSYEAFSTKQWLENARQTTKYF